MCRKEGVLMPVNVNEIEPDEKIVEIEMERLREFRNHPFKVKADGQMLQLIESISKYGVMNPLIVRPLPECMRSSPDIAGNTPRSISVSGRCR